MTTERETTAPWWRGAHARSFLLQMLIVAAIAGLAYLVFANTSANLEKRGIDSGFDFLWRRAGFNISQTPIPYNEDSRVIVAFLVGLINTLILAATAIVLASVIGFAAGIARLSGNWLLVRLASAYVETARNVPLLLQVFFWYFAVLQTLPPLRQSMVYLDAVYLNNRGLYFPWPSLEGSVWILIPAIGIALAAAWTIGYWARRRHARTGRRFPTMVVRVALVVFGPVLAAWIAGVHIDWSVPELRGFNFRGGMVVIPEFLAMALALSVYQGAYVAETVRGGILAVPRGQHEAAAALSLRAGPTLRLVVIPQGLRVIIPPLITIYVSVLRTSSLGVAIGYPDLVSIFAGTLLYQIGQAIEIMTITLLVYLSISLLISALLNRYNRRLIARTA